MRVFEKIVPFLQERLQVSGSVILVGSHERIPIRPDAFIPVTSELKPVHVVFVDGGNGEILKGPNVSVQFVRLYATWYHNNVRVESELKERVVVVIAQKKDVDIVFESKVFDIDGNELSSQFFDPFDPALALSGRRADPASVASYVRKLLELGFAESVIEGLQQGDILVRDGDLESFGSAVEERIKFLRLVADKKQVVVIGLSKTSTLCTDSGNSAVSVLSKLSPAGVWAYYTGGKVGFVKLHPMSHYVFRCDVLQQDRDVLLYAVPLLVANSSDPAFLGYPYGLVEADKFAQVPKDELSQLRARFAVQSREVFRSIEAALDAHDVLNSF